MKTCALFVVSFFALAFGSDAFGRGRNPYAGKVEVISNVEVSGPFVVEVDYAAPLGDLLLALAPHSTHVDDSFVEEYSRKYAGKGKATKNIYVVRIDTDWVTDHLETRAKLKSGALIVANDGSIRREISKKSPRLKRAGPYELFTFVKVHGDKAANCREYHILSDLLEPNAERLAKARKAKAELSLFASEREKYRANGAVEYAMEPVYSLFSVYYRSDSAEPDLRAFRSVAPTTESSSGPLIYID
ncbi:MAG: hypothetical protein WC767_00240 [Candidatus Paceibacterota bacterium]|jgi:Asp-tRNA(Asn)/Glu-tRNA(Gln) amidotransferase A subunit family amidase